MLENVREYDLVALFHPDLEIDIDAPIKKLEKQITDAGGKVIKRDNWGKKRLAYPIKLHQFAVYVQFGLQLEADKVKSVNRALQLSEEIIRYLLVKQPEVKPASKAKKLKADKLEAEPKKEAVNG